MTGADAVPVPERAVSGERRARVLVVDDSAFARKVTRDVLSVAPELDVVGYARDGIEALDRIQELRPDVVTLDLVMPRLDGLGVLRGLQRLGGAARPRIIAVSVSDEESPLVAQALRLGAADYVRKPAGIATDRMYQIGAPLVRTVIAAARVAAARGTVVKLERTGADVATELVVVGTSTGGPQALGTLLSALPRAFPAALAMALHIPAEYTDALARRIGESSELEVLEAEEGLELRPGRAVLARGGLHLEVVPRGGVLVARVAARGAMAYAPSVDLLFESAARACGRRALGVVLTGMGEDGLAGSRALKAAGGRVLTQSERSCVVYGMPRAVRAAGLSDGEADLEEVAAAVVRAL